MSDRLNIIRRVKLQMSGIKVSEDFQEKIMENPCQEGWVAYGTKIKDGREVPNCIPEKDAMKIVKEGFPVPSPEGGEDEQTFISRCIKQLYDEYGQEQSAAICYSKWREK